jgi:hypothetical protein
MRSRQLALFFSCMLSSFATSASCDASAQSSEKEYLKSVQVVQRVPEFKSWERSHNFKVVFGSPMDKQTMLHGRCYWSVSVYADRPERLELWREFYVDLSKNRVLVVNPAGDPVSLSRARKDKLL